ncbi:hypothetical protein FRY97_09840 [Phaeodactylibacter luteus]|uniref:Cytochrome c domain-containing protein n=2 Tax=Phaeodactylibacter luteus TaxID=1564516 RepID=A0A5C6RNU6_9BACT|nr:hypothetical protein FRY97_09840 [Phaeodactylibacter luteus]
MSLIIQAITAIFFAAVGLFVYAIFGHSMMGWLDKGPEPIPIEEIQRRIAEKESDLDRVEGGVHLETGLIAAEGWETVRATCTACHSAKLVTQNKATRDGWKTMIVWMQETQGLWDLGDKEAEILDYLAANYAPEESSRRANLDMDAIEWYILDL